MSERTDIPPMHDADPTASMASLRATAQAAMRAGQWPVAQTALAALAPLAPRDVPIRLQLAEAILRQGRMRAASAPLLEAVAVAPNDAPLLAELAWRLVAQGEVIAARACLAHLARAPEPPAEVLAEQANLRWLLGEIPAARALMDRAVALGIHDARGHYLDAMLHQFVGQLADAEAALLTCLHRWPGHGDAAVILANLRRQTPQANHLALFRAALERLPSPPATRPDALARAKFESAIFKTLDDCGQHEQAWAALARSNALMHQLAPYDAAAEQALVDALLAQADRLAARPDAAPVPADGPVPIFIVGMPRSGSTLLDHMLSAHSQVVSAGELADFPRQFHWMADVAPGGAAAMRKAVDAAGEMDFAALGARYLAQTQWRAHGRRFYVDKLPANLRMVPFIRRALPHAPILLPRRAPMDVCYSNLKVMFGTASPYCYEQRALAHYHRQQARLATHWHTRMPGAVLEVPYADLVTEPAAALRRVLGHCDLPFEQACLHPERNTAAVATPSSAQLREPIHARALGQWRRYASQLEPLRRALEADDTGPD